MHLFIYFNLKKINFAKNTNFGNDISCQFGSVTFFIFKPWLCCEHCFISFVIFYFQDLQFWAGTGKAEAITNRIWSHNKRNVRQSATPASCGQQEISHKQGEEFNGVQGTVMIFIICSTLVEKGKHTRFVHLHVRSYMGFHNVNRTDRCRIFFFLFNFEENMAKWTRFLHWTECILFTWLSSPAGFTMSCRYCGCQVISGLLLPCWTGWHTCSQSHKVSKHIEQTFLISNYNKFT